MANGPGRVTVEEVNRAAWSRRGVVREFARIEDWSGDAGERAILVRVAESARAQPILDLGVGGGRTVPAMLALSHEYVGIDYTPEMVAAARQRFPGVRFEHADARDLGNFADSSFGFVFFSFNGIDAVSHDDRQQIFAEVRRVLRPGGAFGFSTHNLDYPGSGHRPWDIRFLRPRVKSVVGAIVRLPVSLRAYRRNARLVERGQGWAMLVSPAHNFGIIIHYTTLASTVSDLGIAGFTGPVEAFDGQGVPIDPNGDASATAWLNVLARA